MVLFSRGWKPNWTSGELLPNVQKDYIIVGRLDMSVNNIQGRMCLKQVAVYYICVCVCVWCRVDKFA